MAIKETSLATVSAKPREAKRAAYIWLLQSCLEQIYNSLQLPSNEKITFVFEENRMHGASALEQFSELKQAKNWDDKFAGISFQSKRDAIPLQAADVLAYEWYKHNMNQIINPGRYDERKSFLSLTKKRFPRQIVNAGHYDKEALRTFIWRVKQAERTMRVEKRGQ